MIGDLPSSTTCCVAGGGPAGMMLGWLLARAGVDVVVLEKHKDFLRDFRGDTVHSSTIQLMDDLGVVDEFLALNHQRETAVRAQTDDGELVLADFSTLKIKYPFIAYLPQWDFLDFIQGQAERYPGFTLVTSAEVTGVLTENDKVTGVRYRQDGQERELRAVLTVAADGRHSVLREAAGLTATVHGAPMDVMWFRLSRRAGDPHGSFGRLSKGSMLALIDRDDYWQCAYVIDKGSYGQWRERPVQEFRDRLDSLVDWFDGRTVEIESWDDVKVLDVRLDRLDQWYRDGLLAIGDCAHAMSVVGGVGINLAIQDAVATARLLHRQLLAGKVSVRDLAAVQKRRSLPTVVTQRLQKTIQDRFLAAVVRSENRGGPPPILRKLFRLGPLHRLKAKVVAVGIRPERAHRLPAVEAAGSPS
nr:FAD-dependent oxidoreductase [Kibdelosporangium sp. MJ126-NF4]CEL19960.1 Salicylate hydroxylase [Kibdelosporangium sp. MJ126-NF4]CTQ97184.1 Salicylate hydroxylase (EC 1.14.13.1) [Kibdelosporangium sp. MJ126-NF4]